MKDVYLMANSNRGTTKNQSWRNVRIHFDLIKITIKRTRPNWSIRKQQDPTLAVDFCRTVYRNSKLPKLYFCKRFRKVRRDFIFPASQVSIMGTGEHTAATILISNTNLRRPKAHHKLIWQIGNWLARLGYDYCVSIAELALDSCSQDLGLCMATAILPTWARLNRLWNFAEGYVASGGSLDGLDEYMFSGRAIWMETASGKEGHRLPRRQFHAYYKPPGTWRKELRLFRSYLRDKSIRSVEELFRAAPMLITNNIRFWRLDGHKLGKEHSSSRNWRLTGKSVAEQLRIIMERLRCTRRYALRYFTPIDEVDLDLSLFSIPSARPKDDSRVDAAPVRKRRPKRETARPIMQPENWTDLQAKPARPQKAKTSLTNTIKQTSSPTSLQRNTSSKQTKRP